MVVKGIDNSVVSLNPPTKVDVNFREEKITNGVRLWKVGVSLEIFSTIYHKKTEQINSLIAAAKARIGM